MPPTPSSHELPVLREVDNTTSQTRLGDELRVAVIEGSAMSLPEYFQTAEYALNLLVRGRITATINHQRYELEAPCFSSILINQPIQVCGRVHRLQPHPAGQVAVADHHFAGAADCRPPRLPQPKPLRHLLSP